MTMVAHNLFKHGDFVGHVDLSKLFGPLEVPIPLCWFILHVHHGREIKVMKTFRQRNISAWLPLQHSQELVTRYRRGYEFKQQRNVTSPLISGSIIIPDFELQLERWREVEGVIGVYRMDQCVPTLTPQHMNDLRNIEAIGLTPNSKRARAFDLGDLVRVVDGPFRSFCARVERIDSRSRLTIGIEIFGRVTLKQVLESEIEPAPPTQVGARLKRKRTRLSAHT